MQTAEVQYLNPLLAMLLLDAIVYILSTIMPFGYIFFSTCPTTLSSAILIICFFVGSQIFYKNYFSCLNKIFQVEIVNSRSLISVRRKIDSVQHMIKCRIILNVNPETVALGNLGNNIIPVYEIKCTYKRSILT